MKSHKKIFLFYCSCFVTPNNVKRLYHIINKAIRYIEENIRKFSQMNVIINYRCMIGLLYLKKLMLVNFRFQPKVCNGCRNLMQKTMSFNVVAVIFFKGNYYRIHFWYMSQDEAMNIMKNSELTGKVDPYKV